jgi:Na+-translocating ferredoxin:NAD+ oxidoreductase RNF subunit RnfB
LRAKGSERLRNSETQGKALKLKGNTAEKTGDLEMEDKKRIKEIYDALPHLNYDFCGYKNCGRYARMMTEGKAPPNLCLGDYM